MNNNNTIWIVILAVVVALGLLLMPHSGTVTNNQSQAAKTNWKVEAGAETMSGSLQALLFMPKEITIHEGDSITWELPEQAHEEHTIFFPAGGQNPALLFQGKDGRNYFEPTYFIPSEESMFDGSKPISGGVLAPDHMSFTLTFTKSGDYKYICGFHPGMEGMVHVIPSDQPLPKSMADYAALTQSEAGVSLEKATELYQQLNQPQVISHDDGSKEYQMQMLGDPSIGATVLAFVPSKLHIKVGDTVSWKMMDMSEIHTITFANDQKDLPELVLTEPQEKGPPLFVVNSKASDPSGESAHADGGYYNSGFLFDMPGHDPSVYSLTFTKPGTFQYWCDIHPNMTGTIIVEPAIEQVLSENNRKFEEFVKSGDAVSIGAFYADDAKLLPPNAPLVQGRKKITDFWQDFLKEYQSRELTLKTLETHEQGDLAYEVGSYTLTLAVESKSQPIQDSGKYVTVLKRQADGSWEFVADIWNSDLAATASQENTMSALMPQVWNVDQLSAQSQKLGEGDTETTLANLPTGMIQWARLENYSELMHYNLNTYVVYVVNGQFKVGLPDGSSMSIGAGQLVTFPAGVAQTFSGSGDVVYLATPPATDESTVYLEGPKAKPGAAAPSSDKIIVQDVAQRIAQGLDQAGEGFNFAFAQKAETGSVELIRIDKGVALHTHPKGNEILYIVSGHGRGQIGDQTAEVGPGQIVVIPAGVPHKLERTGDEPLDIIDFSTPAFDPNDIVWLK